MTRFSFSRGKTRFFEIFFDIFQVLFRPGLSILLAFIIWVYAFENDPTIEKDFYIDVPVINST